MCRIHFKLVSLEPTLYKYMYVYEINVGMEVMGPYPLLHLIVIVLNFMLFFCQFIYDKNQVDPR